MWRSVVGDVRYRGLLDVHDASLQTGRPAENIVVRMSVDPIGVASAIRAIARELDPTSVVDNSTTLEAVFARAEAPWRLTMWLFVLFVELAVALSPLGSFALVVAQRQREFAIRPALGASHTSIARGVLVRWRVAAGAVLGVVIALHAGLPCEGCCTALLRRMVGLTIVALTLLFAATAIAAFPPARRADRVEPQTLLCQE
jgi:ABC-type lipoprotein release transport system permease subunit